MVSLPRSISQLVLLFTFCASTRRLPSVLEAKQLSTVNVFPMFSNQTA